jgi:hypothetical protein
MVLIKPEALRRIGGPTLVLTGSTFSISVQVNKFVILRQLLYF